MTVSLQASLRERVAAAARRARAEWALRSGQTQRARAFLDGSRAMILMYHRVLPEPAAQQNCVEPGMYVTPETFASQLDWLGEHFRVLPLGEIVTRIESGASLPLGACAITFDDGWRDNFDHALPALLQRGIPATIFVVTGRVGTSGAFWPDEVCRQMGAMSAREKLEVLQALGVTAGADPVQAMLSHLKRVPDEQRESLLESIRSRAPGGLLKERELMDEAEISRLPFSGIDVESHGVSHAILTGVGPESVARELEDSRAWLRERGLGGEGLLAYPSGACSEKIAQSARDAGYRAAVTTHVALAAQGGDPFTLPRIGVHEDVSRSRAEFLYRVPGFH